jgi:gentisate 1,2-dioxygenase
LLGPELLADGAIKDPVRVDWVKGAAFVTPPGYWHEHVNASSAEAFVLPIQDAGLHTYLRTLDIQFFKD